MGKINDIITESQRIQKNIKDSLEEVKNKGLTMTGEETSDDLPSLVTSLYEGNGNVSDTTTELACYNGTKWNACTGVDGVIFKKVFYKNGVYVAVGDSDENGDIGTIYYSRDAKSWNSANFDGYIPYSNGYYNLVGNVFIVSNYEDYSTLYSVDGINWHHCELDISVINNNTSAFAGFRKVCYTNGVYVGIGHDDITSDMHLFYSHNAIDWNYIQSLEDSNGNLTSVLLCEGGIFYITLSVESAVSTCLYSRDGINWNSIVIPDTGDSSGQGLVDIKYINDIWIGLGYDDLCICYSVDGINWINTEFNVGISSFTYEPIFSKGNTILMSDSSYPCIYISIDNGRSWDTLSITIDDGTLVDCNTLYGLAYANGLFFTESADDELFTLVSSDGVNWSKINIDNTRIFGKYTNDSAIEYCTGVYVSDYGFYSYDGYTWYNTEETANVVHGVEDLPFIKNANGKWIKYNDISHQLEYSVTWEEN